MKEKDHNIEFQMAGMDRRRFLQVMGASLAMAGMAGCTRQAPEAVVPYVVGPEKIVPGKPLFYATTLTLGGYGIGVLAETHMGRPTKLEGNPSHPASLGATSAIVQAMLLDLYDPARARGVTAGGQTSSWAQFTQALGKQLELEAGRDGAGMRIVIGATTSPTTAKLIGGLRRKYPRMNYCVHEPLNQYQVIEGLRQVAGRRLQPVYDLDNAKVIVSFDGDFLYEGPGAICYARAFGGHRKPRAGQLLMNRLYTAECTPTVTGSIADYRLAAKPGRMEFLIGTLRAMLRGGAQPQQALLTAAEEKWLRRAARDLQSARGQALVIAGPRQPTRVHALAALLNNEIDASGATVQYIEPVETVPAWEGQSLDELAQELQSGAVKTLIILDSNPAYSAPRRLGLADAIAKTEFSAVLSLYRDETAQACAFHLPQAHALEAWGDAHAFNGTFSLAQPTIPLLFEGKSIHELLWLIANGTERPGYQILRDSWQEGYRGNEAFDGLWKKTLQDGVLAGSTAPAVAASLRSPTDAAPAVKAEQGLEVVFAPDPNILDGRFANNAWLQELQKPFTTLTWQNAMYLSPTTARRHGLENGDVVTIEHQGRTCEGPVMMVPGHAEDCVTLFFGYGRRSGAELVQGEGYDAYMIWAPERGFQAAGAALKPSGRKVVLPVLAHHHQMHGRDIVKRASLPYFSRHPDFTRAHSSHQPESLYPDYERDTYEWGMVIDLSSCIGCNACTLACQAENNIPTVGKEGVLRGREMHWIRVDNYFEDNPEDPAYATMPVPCMHCEKAPCEVVCPTSATTHSSDGLNQMVYNRCVGTRYCSNNCPYKVRRFNFFNYAFDRDKLLTLQRNPDVSVRERGVMEKCTYCVQRISEARISAEKENRLIRDGEAVPACAAACPTRAITFGNVSDAGSEVAGLKRQPHNYDLLAELGTRPRTTYLARIKNVEEEKPT